MSVYEDRVLPRVVDKLLDNDDVAAYRQEACSGLSGVVVEIGFGSGLNVPHYPSVVERVLAVDPAELGRELATERLRHSRVDVEFVGLDGESLPIDDASVDGALSTFTLCTIPDVDRAIREVYRVLRPGARFNFVEHGRAEAARPRRWQDRIDPLWKRVAGGCHLNRPIDDLLRGAGFTDVTIHRSVMGSAMIGGAITGSIYSGRAVR
jgi:ubiquinone/menaquinone biosynthesis C-methylase UbiE